MEHFFTGIASSGAGAPTAPPWKMFELTEVQKLILMLYTLALILIIAWLLGIVSGYTMGNFIYILLVVAVIMILVRLIQGKQL